MEPILSIATKIIPYEGLKPIPTSWGAIPEKGIATKIIPYEGLKHDDNGYPDKTTDCN